MIRSNVGNIVTNGQQAMSVGAFTAGGLKRSLGKADTALNNLSKEELTQYRQAQADDMRRKINKSQGSDVESVDEIMDGTSSDDSSTLPTLQENSEQVQELNLRMRRDREWFQSWYDTRIKGKLKISNKTKSEFLKHMRGDDSNADV